MTGAVKRLVGRAVLPVTRRINFPGKRRLRTFVDLPESGTREVSLLGGRFRVDMTESMQRDYYFGVYDEVELAFIRRLLRDGGDFVDVGGHIGTYTVLASKAIGNRGRVLTFEPNPTMRARLEENIRLNECANVIVRDAAVSDTPGRVTLYVPRVGDVGWSSLSQGWVGASDAIEVEATTLDAEVARHGLQPSVVKIDVESYETQVLRGARSVLEGRPALLIEVVEGHAEEVLSTLAPLGYLVARAGTRHLGPWPAEPRASNALFVQPEQLARLRPKDRRAFARA